MQNGQLLTPRVDAWRSGGELTTVDGHRLFVRRQAGKGPPVVFLHGYPSSSYDWRQVLERLASRRLTAFDFLGFGLSDKPPDHLYSLLGQADAVEAMAARSGYERLWLVAHDMGTSVATELLARDLEGRLRFGLDGVLLFNGSMVIERASLTTGQKILRSRFGPLAARLTSQWSFQFEFARIFSSEHPLSGAEAQDQWSLLTYNRGHRIVDRLIFYLHERVAYARRWHGALRDWPGRLELAWAGRDPICTEAVLQAVLELRPRAPVTRLADLGHYPQLEDPSRVAAIIERFSADGTASR